MSETGRREKKESKNYRRTNMRKEQIFQKLREKGCRITKQRQRLLDVILREECASCKEIYYKAREEHIKIGMATVYRMVNLLEEIGAISRKNMYRLSFYMDGNRDIVCVVELDDHTVCRLSAGTWNRVMREGMKVCGYIDGQQIVGIVMEAPLTVDGAN